MRTIWKYDLHPANVQVIAMPEGAYVLDCQEQFGLLRIWAEVDTEAPIVSRPFGIIGTGGDVPNPATSRHIATVQVGSFVWHVYEPKEYAR